MAGSNMTASLRDAIQSGDVDVVIDLLDNDEVDVNVNDADEDCNLETPLMRLCHWELPEEDLAAILEFVLLRKPDVNQTDREGRTALAHACMSGLVYFIRRLSRTPGCSPNMADCYGNTPLMFGVYYGQVQVVEALMQSFNNLNIAQCNNEGVSALDIAEQNEFKDVANVLREALAAYDLNADLDLSNQPAQTDDTNQENSVGHKTHNFRRKKLKPALGPLVVQNRLQSSKSADYVQYYRENNSGDTQDKGRMYPHSAAAGDSYGRPEFSDPRHRRYRPAYRQLISYESEEQYSAEDESDESSSSAEDSNNRTGYDEGYGDQDYGQGYHGPRRSSISLPDLHAKLSGALVGATGNNFSVTTIADDGPSGSFYDSGYDARSSQFTVTREELCLPNLPEAEALSSTDGEGTDRSNRTPLTPRSARRDSWSLPDLRGYKRGLVASNQTDPSPALISLKEVHTSNSKIAPSAVDAEDLYLESVANTARDYHDNEHDDVASNPGDSDGESTEDRPSQTVQLPEVSGIKNVANTPREDSRGKRVTYKGLKTEKRKPKQKQGLFTPRV